MPGGEELQEHRVHERAYLLVADAASGVSGDRWAGSASRS
jgi:hypothetical protein